MRIKRPLIGIPTNLSIVEEGPFAGIERVYVNRDYAKCIWLAGGIPLLLPILCDQDAISHQIDSIDGLLLTGGQDVNPPHYGEQPCSLLESVCPERDEFELAAVRYAHALGKPILGICRGLQLINVAFGGSLYQDIATHYPKPSIKHAQNERKGEPCHAANLVKGSSLNKIMEVDALLVNSLHHQSIKDLAPGFVPCAHAEDFIIEGIEKQTPPFVMGIQWHPELMAQGHPLMLKLFQGFILEVIQAKEVHEVQT